MARKSTRKTAARKSAARTTSARKTRSTTRARGTAKRARRPAKRSRKPDVSFHEGPAEWLGPMLEEAYARLRPKDAGGAPEFAAAAGAGARAEASAALASAHEAGEAGEVPLADLPKSYWEDLLREVQATQGGRAGGGRRAARDCDAGRPRRQQLDAPRPFGHVARADARPRGDQRSRVGLCHRTWRSAHVCRDGQWRRMAFRRRSAELALDDGGLRRQPDELRHREPRSRRHRDRSRRPEPCLCRHGRGRHRRHLRVPAR